MKIKMFEDFKTRNFTVQDIVQCIDRGGVLYAAVIRGLPGNDPDLPLRPVSVDDFGSVTVYIDGQYHEVDLRNVDRIEWSGDGAYRVDESLDLSGDLSDLVGQLADSGDKVAGFLKALVQSDVYPDAEDVNRIDLSTEINKFSFVPTNRRNKIERFDIESMPTRIGKIVKKIYKTAQKFLSLEKKGNFKIKLIGDYQDPQVRDTYGDKGPKRGMTRYNVYLDQDMVPFVKLGNVEMSLSVDGREVEATIHEIDYDYVWNKDAYRRLEKIVFDSPDEISEGEVNVGLSLKSDFVLTDSDVEEFVNGVVAYLKVNRSGDDSVMEQVTGEDIRFWYNRDNYQSTKGELGNSCMSHHSCQSYLDLYCMNPDKVALVILKTKENKLIGRALLWTLDNGKKFMDRVYSILNSDARVFRDHAIKNSWVYKLGKFDLMYGDKDYTKDLSVTLRHHEFYEYPYLDTLRYLNEDGVLSNYGSSEDKYLNSTDGGYEYDD
jgi:hypothetical protein